MEMIKELAVSAVYDLLKGTVEQIFSKTPIQRAAQKTCQAFTKIEELAQYLRDFLSLPQVLYQVEELRQGKPSVPINDLVDILLDKTDFHWGENTPEIAKKVLERFFYFLNEELLASESGHVIQTELIKRVDIEHKAEHRATQDGVRKVQDTLDQLMTRMATTSNTAAENEDFKRISAANKRRVDSAKALLAEGKPVTAKKLYLEIIEDLNNDKNPDATLLFRANNNLGSCEFQIGDYAKAAEFFMKASRYLPDDVKGLSNTALALLFKNQPDEALQYADKAIAISNNEEYPRTIKARILAKIGRYDEGIKLLETGPQGKDSFFVAASIYLDVGSHDKAIECARRLLELSEPTEHESKEFLAQCLLLKIEKRMKGEGILYFELSDPEREMVKEAIALYKDALVVLKDMERTKNRQYSLTNLGALLIASGQFEEAIRTSDEALLIDPRDKNALQNKGISALAVRKDSLAAETFERLLEAAGPNEEILWHLGMAYLEDGRPEVVLKLLKEKDLTPRLGALLAQAHLRNQDFHAALGTLNHLTEKYPQNSDVLRQYADYFLSIGDTKEYERKLQAAITCASQPDKKLLELTLADFYYDSKDYVRADEIYARYNKPQIDSPIVKKHLTCLFRRSMLADCLKTIKDFKAANKADKFILEVETTCNHLLGNLEDAAAGYLELSKKSPSEASYMLSRCECLFRTGKLNEAVDLLTATRNRVKDEPEKLMAVAEAFDYMGKRSDALEAGYDALAKSPDKPDMHRAYINLFLRREQDQDAQLDQKYITKFQDSIENFEKRFPNDRGLVAMKSSGDLKEIFDMISTQSQRGKMLLDAYKENHLPIHCLAKLSGQNFFTTWGVVVSLGTPRVWVSDGNPEEAIMAVEQIKNSKEIVFDIFSLFTLCKLKILPQVTSLFDRVYVVQAVQDSIITAISDLQFNAKKGFMVLSEQDGKYFRTEVTPEIITMKLQFLEEVKEYAKDKLTGLSREYSEEERKFKEAISGPGLDTILVARERRLPICSDDKALLHLANNEHGIKGFSSYFLLKKCYEEKLISGDEFLEKVLTLLELNYFYTPVNLDILMAALEKYVYQVTREVGLLLDVLGMPETGEGGSVELSASVIVRIWLTSCMREDRLKILDALLSRLAIKNRALIPKLKLVVRSKFKLSVISLAVQEADILQEIDNWVRAQGLRRLL